MSFYEYIEESEFWEYWEHRVFTDLDDNDWGLLEVED